MEKFNKNLIIGVLAVIAIISGVFWYNQNQELTKLKTANTISPSTQSVQQEELTAEDWSSDPYSWQKLKCSPTSKVFCDRTSCTSDTPSVWVILDRRAKTFSRCDTKGCDTYDGQFESAGAFTNIQSKNPMGEMIKVLGDRKYIEIATLNLGLFISSGVCTEIQ